MIIVFGLCTILMIFGAVEICRAINLHMYKSKEEGYNMLVIPIGPHNEDAELLIRSAAARVSWDYGIAKKLICLDCGMDDNTRQVCENLKWTYNFLEIKTVDELDDILSSFEKSNVV